MTAGEPSPHPDDAVGPRVMKMPSSEYVFLLSAFRARQPETILCFGTDAEAARFQHVVALARKAGLQRAQIFALPLPAADAAERQRLRDKLIAQLRQRDRPVDHMIFAAEFPLDAVAEWLEVAPTLLSPGGIVSGAHYLPAGPGSFGRAGVGMDVLFAADCWYMTSGMQPLPKIPPNIRGVPEPIRFGCMETDLPGVASREKFLEYAAAGLPCRFGQYGGEKFVNPPHENLREAPQEKKDRIVYAPPYQEEGLTEGRFLAFLRNARVAGFCHHVYSAENSLYEDSLASSRLATPPMRDAIATYEKTISKATLTVGNASREQLCVLRTPTVRIDEPTVIIPYNNCQNFTHWMLATLPRLWYREEFPELAGLPIAMGPIVTRFQRESLELLGFGGTDRPRFIHFNPSVTLSFDRAYFPTLVDRPHTMARVCDWMRGHFLPKAATLPEGCEGGRYYITRRDGLGRSVVNEDEMIALAEARGFKVLEWSAYSLAEQIALARHASMVICYHGSGLVNMVFASPGCRLLEILQNGEGMYGSDWFSFLVTTQGGRLFGVLGDPLPGKPIHAADLTVPIDEFRAALDQMIES